MELNTQCWLSKRTQDTELRLLSPPPPFYGGKATAHHKVKPHVVPKKLYSSFGTTWCLTLWCAEGCALQLYHSERAVQFNFLDVARPFNSLSLVHTSQVVWMQVAWKRKLERTWQMWIVFQVRFKATEKTVSSFKLSRNLFNFLPDLN
jgi:hypothetical protein